MNPRLIPLPIALAFAVAACAPTKKVEASAEISYEEKAPPPQVEAPPPAPPALRLPEGVHPVKYTAELSVDPSADQLSGMIEIELQFDKPTKLLWLNASGLTFRSASLVDQGMQQSVKQVATSDDFVGFEFPKEMTGRTRFRASYTAPVSAKEMTGAFRQKEGDDWYVFTQFESFHAREVFPCFDEPSFKTPWELTLTVPGKLTAVSNQPAENEMPLPNGQKQVKFKLSKPLPSYVVAFAVGPFDALDAGQVGFAKTPVRVLALKGHKDEAQYAAEVTEPILKKLESYFGMAYPYEKLDLVAIPIFHLAMENPGLVTFGAESLLAKPEEDTVERQRHFARTYAHELAHMWFGDLVTVAWWDDLWLKESFSEWLSNKVVGEWKPEWQRDAAEVNSIQRAMMFDSYVAAKPVHRAVETKGDIVQAYDPLTYEKGEAVIGMVENWVTPDKFRGGVRKYLKAHAWKNATKADFLAALSEEAGQDVAPLFDAFVEQPGVPLVKVELDCKGKAPVLHLSQSRYLPLGAKAPADQVWPVPVRVRYGVGKDSANDSMLLKSKAEDMPLTQVQGCVDWLYANDGQLGYYRTALGAALLGDVLKKGQLSAAEQVGLLGDMGAAGRSGDLPAAEVLKVLPKFAASDNRFVVMATAQLVGALDWNLVPDELRPNYRRFIAKTFGPRAKKLGLAPGKKETDDTRAIRTATVALVGGPGGDAAMQKESRQLTEKWLKDRRAISPDLVDMVTGLAGRTADAGFHQKLVDAAKAATDRHDRMELLMALAATTDPALAQKNLELLRGTDFDPREGYVLLWGALGDPRTRNLAYEFIKQDWDQMSKSLPKQAMTHVVGIVSAFCDRQHRDDAEAFFKSRVTGFPGADKTLEHALESVDLCIAHKEKQQASVSAFLRGY